MKKRDEKIQNKIDSESSREKGTGKVANDASDPSDFENY